MQPLISTIFRPPQRFTGSNLRPKGSLGRCRIQVQIVWMSSPVADTFIGSLRCPHPTRRHTGVASDIPHHITSLQKPSKYRQNHGYRVIPAACRFDKDRQDGDLRPCVQIKAAQSSSGGAWPGVAISRPEPGRFPTAHRRPRRSCDRSDRRYGQPTRTMLHTAMGEDRRRT